MRTPVTVVHCTTHEKTNVLSLKHFLNNRTNIIYTNYSHIPRTDSESLIIIKTDAVHLGTWAPHVLKDHLKLSLVSYPPIVAIPRRQNPVPIETDTHLPAHRLLFSLCFNLNAIISQYSRRYLKGMNAPNKIHLSTNNQYTNTHLKGTIIPLIWSCHIVIV